MEMEYFDRSGQLITLEQFAQLHRTLSYKRVAFAKVGEVEVSTVWLGINHAFLPDRPPLIFETMVFGGELDQEQERYTNEADAFAGHRRWVRLVEAAIDGDAG